MAKPRFEKACAFVTDNLLLDVASGTGKDCAIGTVKSGVGLGVGLAINGVASSGDIVSLTANVAGLGITAGAHLYHTHGMKKKVQECLDKYVAVDYLENRVEAFDAKATTWTTTPAFHKANFLTRVYKDIEQYIELKQITEAELDYLGWHSDVCIHESKQLPSIIKQLSQCCQANGVRDITQTDLEKRFNNISFPHIGVIALTNAFLAEEERCKQRQLAGLPEDHQVVPVLGRILSLVALCGISEIRLADLTFILGKAPMFETVARSRIAALRGEHPSHIINGLLFGGSTQSAARDFAQQAMSFRDERTVVGRIESPGKAAFDTLGVHSKCEFTGVDKNFPVGTPIYMLAGWAKLASQRESFEKEHSTLKQMVHVHTPSMETDVHGNKYMHPGSLGKLKFTVKELPDGTLMAKPQQIDKFDYLSSANYDKGRGKSKATGEEKHFGGMVGPVNCGCSPDVAKGLLTQKWKYGDTLKISSKDYIGNSIEHTKHMSTKHLAILWRTGDWPLGVFLMQTLPQSSYLQGRGECLHCAVENAALAGCPEVIACGGGRVSAEARASESQVVKPVLPPQAVYHEAVQPILPSKPVIDTTVAEIFTPLTPTSSIMTPPPPYSSPTPTSRQRMESYFALSDARGDKIITSSQSTAIRRKPVGSSAAQQNQPTIDCDIPKVSQSGDTFKEVVVDHPLQPSPFLDEKMPVEAAISPPASYIEMMRQRNQARSAEIKRKPVGATIA